MGAGQALGQSSAHENVWPLQHPVGRSIAQVAARHLQPVVLELGGKAPFIVLPGADIASAVATATFGAFMNQGQTCMTTQRLILHKDVSAAFQQGLIERVAGLVIGDPTDPRTQIGCLIDARATQRMHDLLDDAVNKGATVLVGGGMRGPAFEPAVVADVTPDMRLYTEEAFGPLVPLIEVQSVDEAVRIANESEYGLSAAVFTAHLRPAWDIASRLKTGVVHINDVTLNAEPQMPFGGVKSSGYGRFGGRYGLNEFTEVRWITVQSKPRTFPL